MPINIQEIEKDLIELADFEEQESVSRARSFVTAAKRWLILRPQMATRDGNTLSMSHAEVANLLRRAQSYVESKTADSAATSRVRFFSVENDFR